MSTKKKDTKTEFLSVRVAPETKKSLEKIAEKQDRTLSWLVAKILKDYLAVRARKDRADRRLRS